MEAIFWGFKLVYRPDTNEVAESCTMIKTDKPVLKRNLKSVKFLLNSMQIGPMNWLCNTQCYRSSSKTIPANNDQT